LPVRMMSLDGKSCLSGLVGDGDDVIVFSMMMQGFRYRNLAAVRGSQVGAVNAMMRYVREGTGERIELPSGFEEQLAADDIEGGGAQESGEEGESDPLETPQPGAAPAPALAPGEDAVDAFLRQARGGAPTQPPPEGARAGSGAGGAPAAPAIPASRFVPMAPPPQAPRPSGVGGAGR